MEKKLRDAMAQEELGKDKVMLETALARERALEQLEAEERLARRKEIVELQTHYNQQAADKNAYEKMIDELVSSDNAKQWDAREKQWRRED